MHLGMGEGDEVVGVGREDLSHFFPREGTAMAHLVDVV